MAWQMPLDEQGKPDFGPVIRTSLQAWRASDPAAEVVNVGGRRDLLDADFVHLKGIKALNMSWCNQAGITDEAFKSLEGIHTLNMSSCSQAGITDEAFQSLKGIHTLDMRSCNQKSISGTSFIILQVF